MNASAGLGDVYSIGIKQSLQLNGMMYYGIVVGVQEVAMGVMCPLGVAH